MERKRVVRFGSNEWPANVDLRMNVGGSTSTSSLIKEKNGKNSKDCVCNVRTQVQTAAGWGCVALYMPHGGAGKDGEHWPPPQSI